LSDGSRRWADHPTVIDAAFKFNRGGPIALIGSIAFLALGIFSKWVGNPAEWGWGALIFYIFMAIGRAVYESTNKAIFADFFPGEKSPGAFANVFVFGTGASTVAFVLGASSSDMPELYLMLVFGVLTFPGFVLASFLSKRDRAREEPDKPALV